MEKMTNSLSIETKLGAFSKKKFNDLIDVRELTLASIRNKLKSDGLVEVLTASLVNIAGSCENPNAAFTLPYYGREVHLSQSAQIQLETLVVALNRSFFTVNNSFREENFEDPSSQGRRLSEFTLIEPEFVFRDFDPNVNLSILKKEIENLFKFVIHQNLSNLESKLHSLGSDVNYLSRILQKDFPTITYSDAINILNKNSHGKLYMQGDEINIQEEIVLLKHFDYSPFFITHFPISQKLFNVKIKDKYFSYSLDLIAPRLGEIIGCGVREEDISLIETQLLKSKVGEFIQSKRGNPLIEFDEYFNTIRQSEIIPHGGFGIGFERLIGFLLQSNDILDTISYRTLVPISM